MKKWILIALCVALMAAAMPQTVVAAPEEASEATVVIRNAKRIYEECLESAEKESFAGFCGLMTSHQLWHMGINSWMESYDGNQQFDAYAAKEMTSGGYYITAYPSDRYTLKEALNTITRNGTRDAYNILVGFEKTDTEEGQKYGHACVINAIIDGTVYFVESFYTSLGGEEGNVIACSIDKFANYFADWTVFDGVIHFNKSYAEGGQRFGTNLFVRLRFDSVLRSQPCLLNEHDCYLLRSLQAGELLHATAVCKNDRDELYYHIQDGKLEGYVSANAVSVIRFNSEDMTVTEQDIPASLQVGKKLSISGAVVAENSTIDTIKAIVTDMSGNTALQAEFHVNDHSFNLKAFNRQLGAGALPQGAYILTVQAKTSNAVAASRELYMRYMTVDLLKSPLKIGDVETVASTPPATVASSEGWTWDGTVWYYYRDGKPVSGWLRDLSVAYYLNEDGSVTTGWAEIDGAMRYFSATGAMCSGWLSLEEGVYYLKSDGIPARGLQQADGRTYCFDENGLLMRDCVVDIEDERYTIDAFGAVIN